MYQIIPSPDPYSPLIAAAIAREFPTQLVSGDDELVDLIANEILGSKQQRFGPKPNAESQVAIREVIRFNVNQATPIPFLVPWGSMKPDYSSVDLAELWGLKTLRCLNARVAGHYAPGATFNIRVEDASAPNIFYDRASQTRAASAVYADAFIAMMEILELYPMVQVVRESLHITEEEFTAEAETILPVMLMAISEPSSIHVHKQLGDLGWKGVIHDNMKRFYFVQYDKLYPDDTKEQHAYRLARYLSGSLARKRLGVTGASPQWQGKFIELSFMPPVPGTGAYFGRRVYYRTLPSRMTRNHMPPWRAKGYMLIHDEDEPVSKLASFREPRNYNRNTVDLVNESIAYGDKSVTVQADYIIT